MPIIHSKYYDSNLFLDGRIKIYMLAVISLLKHRKQTVIASFRFEREFEVNMNIYFNPIIDITYSKILITQFFGNFLS